jgi:hypothetical protein
MRARFFFFVVPARAWTQSNRVVGGLDSRFRANDEQKKPMAP